MGQRHRAQTSNHSVWCGLRWLSGVALAALVLSLSAVSGHLGAAHAATPNIVPVTQTFSYTGGEQTFTVPAGVHAIDVVAVGGTGAAAGAAGGNGARVTANIVPVTPGQTLYVEVGGNGGIGAAGWNGGGSPGSYQAGGGGGASDVRTCSISNGSCPALGSAGDPRLVVAGGGGGAGLMGWCGTGPNGAGGAGGAAGSPGLNGADECGATGGQGGGAGSSTGPGSGGAGGTGSINGGAGSSGTAGVGGAGGANLGCYCWDAGGGGGGYYGGGGGGAAADGNSGYAGSGGGGGGSSYVTPTAAGSSVTTDAGGTPQITISYVQGQVFAYTGGEQTVTVPSGVSRMDVLAIGGHGFSYVTSSGGFGAQVAASNVPVTPGQTLYVEVGGNASGTAPGWNGGGAGGGSYGGGGGASDVRTCSLSNGFCPALGSASDPRLVVAGGGGGAGSPGKYAGGKGGNADSAGGSAGSKGGGGGGAGTTSAGGAGGAGGVGADTSGANGVSGSAGSGGAGGGGAGNGGGGGGGYYGGGGGGGGGSTEICGPKTCSIDAGGGGGGGGGASYVTASAGSSSITTDASGTPEIVILFHHGITLITPVRVLDTRNNTGGYSGQQCAGSTLTLTLAGSNGIPSDALGIVGTLRAVNPSNAGYLTAYPGTGSPPTASNLNFTLPPEPSYAISDQITVGLDGSGKMSIYVGGLGCTQVVLDISGYITSGSQVSLLPPSRVLDTRTGTGAPKAQVCAGQTLTLTLGGSNGVPATATGIVGTLRATGPTNAGYLTMYPGTGSPPTASNLNFTLPPEPSYAMSDAVMVGLDSSGKASIYVGGMGCTDVVFDLSGYISS